MSKIFSIVLLGIAVSVAAFATPVTTPEIDPASGFSAITLLAGASLVVRARRKQ